MLAGWARLKFPHLVYASVSNSSPVQAQLDFPEYYDHVSFALSYEVVGGSEECLNIMSGGHAQVAEIFNKYDAGEGNDDDLEKVADLFNVCGGADGLKDKMNRNVFLGDGLISMDIQGNDPSCTGKLCNIEKICTYLTEKDESVSSIERLAELYHEQRPGDCQEPSWEGMLEFLSSQNAQIEGIRSWIWQTCHHEGRGARG